MAKKKLSKKPPVKRKVALDCVFCKKEKDPNYKDYKALAKFLSDRAKVLGKDRTGICSKHQRSLTREIKRARHLGLLPFASQV